MKHSKLALSRLAHHCATTILYHCVKEKSGAHWKSMLDSHVLTQCYVAQMDGKETDMVLKEAFEYYEERLQPIYELAERESW